MMLKRSYPNRRFEVWYAYYPTFRGNGYCYVVLCYRKVQGRSPNVRLIKKIEPSS